MSGRIKELDGIRGIAIILVLIWHYLSCQILPEPQAHPLLTILRKATRLTWSGVDLFFVLSGFLIVGILIDHKHSPNFFKAFYIRRICRIFPIYYLMIFLFIIIRSLNLENIEWLFANPFHIGYYLTYTQNFIMAHTSSYGAPWFAVTWSLAIEEQFYLVIPLLVRNFNIRKLTIIFLSLILLSPIFRSIGTLGYGAFFYPFARADSLMLGGLLAIIMRNKTIWGFMKRNYSSLCYLFVLFFIGAGILTYWSNGFGGPFNHLWLALFYAIFILLPILNNKNFTSKILRNPILVWFGLRSYGIYLYHFTVCGLMHALFFNSPPMLKDWERAGVTLLSLVATLAISDLSFRLIEKPIIAYGHRFKYREEFDPDTEAGPC
ncbi:acyltransferase family protein [candidate division CSSED10-310 bacterium]|uniref:Acyltransferase family protein n=1 Tax=candidate division CSSED10-310 bacterium TaxID=2855610 RepID=A0ABV6YQY3_UNCC1